MVDNGLGSTALYADNPAERDDAEESSCLWDMIVVVVVKSSAPTTTNNIMVVCLDGGAGLLLTSLISQISPPNVSCESSLSTSDDTGLLSQLV